MSYGTAVTVDRPYVDVVEQVREALREQGFGILTEIDVQATMREKLGEQTGPHLILGACNPPLAYRALTAEPSIGLLLPCNVVVREDPQDTATVHIEAMNPQLMAQVVDNPALAPIADEVTEKIRTVIDTLADTLRTA